MYFVLLETMEKDKNIIYEHFRKEIQLCKVPGKEPISEFLVNHGEHLSSDRQDWISVKNCINTMVQKAKRTLKKN